MSRVFPAHAGMFHPLIVFSVKHPSFPRARGDVPHQAGYQPAPSTFSPRTRGCSAPLCNSVGQQHVFPAHAGMFHVVAIPRVRVPRFPRARGDVPPPSRHQDATCAFSPRTRGCSYSRSVTTSVTNVFPAHAGMFRRGVTSTNLRSSFPRARGDVPRCEKRGENAFTFSPRTRGCS